MFIFAATALMGFLQLPRQLFWIISALAGIGLAGVWTADRPYMLRLTPPEKVGEFYGLYGMVGRFAAITGPLLWGLIVDVWDLGRPTAVLSLLVWVVIGYSILRGVSDERRTWDTDTAPPDQTAPS
jgi:UMF1 family MFS transporter